MNVNLAATYLAKRSAALLTDEAGLNRDALTMLTITANSIATGGRGLPGEREATRLFRQCEEAKAHAGQEGSVAEVVIVAHLQKLAANAIEALLK